MTTEPPLKPDYRTVLQALLGALAVFCVLTAYAQLRPHRGYTIQQTEPGRVSRHIVDSYKKVGDEIHFRDEDSLEVRLRPPYTIIKR